MAQTLGISMSTATWLSLAMPRQQTVDAKTDGIVPQERKRQNPIPETLSKLDKSGVFQGGERNNVVRTPLNNVNAYHDARGLMQRANDLMAVKEAIGQTITTISNTDKGVSKIGSLVEKARDLTVQAYASLGNDAASVAKRRELAGQFNALKKDVDNQARTAVSSGNTLLAVDTHSYSVDADSRKAINAISGLSAADVTNLSAADRYQLRIDGSGLITGNLDDVEKARRDRGILSLSVSGQLSGTAGNFGAVSISLSRDAESGWSLTLKDGDESITYGLFTDKPTTTQPSVQPPAPPVPPAPPNPPAPPDPTVETIALSGNISYKEVTTITVAGQEFSYKATHDDIQGQNPETRRQTVATNLQKLVSEALSSQGYTVSAAKDGAFTVTHPGSASPPPPNTPPTTPPGGTTPPTNGTPPKMPPIGTPNGTAEFLTAFSSGTIVSLKLDRAQLEALGTAAVGTSTVEKSIDLSISATNLGGWTVTRSAANRLGEGRLSGGENAFAFDSGTVRLSVDPRTIQKAASANAEGTLISLKVEDENAGQKRAVPLGEKASNILELPTIDVSTGGKGLQLDFAQNDWTDRRDIDKAMAQLGVATQNVETANRLVSVNMEIVRTRDSFAASLSAILAEGANLLTRAVGPEKDAENLLKETREQLKETPYSLAAAAQPAIRGLFPETSSWLF